MSTSDLHKDHPNPLLFPQQAICADCLHFKRAPLYRVEGKRVPCSHSLIAREAQDQPCINFTPDTFGFLDLPVEIQKQLFALITSIEKFAQDKTTRIVAAETLLASWLLTSVSMAKKGYTFGSKCSFSGDKRGRLLYTDGKKAIVKELSTDIVYHLPLESIVIL